LILITAKGDKLDLLGKRGLRLLSCLRWLRLTKVLLLAASTKLLLSSLELLPLEELLLLLWLCCCLLLGPKGLVRGELRLWLLLTKLLLWLLAKLRVLGLKKRLLWLLLLSGLLQESLLRLLQKGLRLLRRKVLEARSLESLGDGSVWLGSKS